MKIRNQYMKPKRYYTNTGEKVHVIYQGKYNDDGVLELVEVGKESIVDMIQSHAESVDINVILERYREGDMQALQRRQAMFGDFTMVPKTYADILNLSLQGQQLFDSLPLSEKEKYDFDFAKYLASFGKLGNGPDGSAEPKAGPAEQAERASEKGDAE